MSIHLKFNEYSFKNLKNLMSTHLKIKYLLIIKNERRDKT